MSIVKNLCLIGVCLLLWQSCSKDDDTATVPETSMLICNAGCSSMSWSVVGESGLKTTDQSCRRQYQGSRYIETCEGEMTYLNSGKKYQFKVVYNWPNCTMELEVVGLGNCSS